jgi:hypothetical protein
MPTENLEHCNSGHLCLSLPKNLDASLPISARIANQNDDRYDFLHSKRVLKVGKSTLARQPNWGATNERSKLIQPRFHYVMENRTCPPQSPRSGPPAPEKHPEPESLTTARLSRRTQPFWRKQCRWCAASASKRLEARRRPEVRYVDPGPAVGRAMFEVIELNDAAVRAGRAEWRPGPSQPSLRRQPWPWR